MFNLPTPLEELSHPILKERSIQLFVKRDDQTHPEIMGNKLRKLKYNLQKVVSGHKEGIVTLGGAYSNHIAATAAATKAFNLKSIGIIRGDELNVNSNPTLQYAAANGMDLRFIDRQKFSEWRNCPDELMLLFPDHYFLPEGGTNQLAIKGCKEVIMEIDIPFDLIVTPIGTGGTFCGLISGIKPDQKALGISVLKGDFIRNEISELLKKFQIDVGNYEINSNYHFGGYAKTNQTLINFINWFKKDFHIQLDPIYTGKSFFATWELIKNHAFEKNLRIVLLHTGGLQGIKGFNQKNENIIQ